MAEARTTQRADILLELARCEVRAGAVDQAWRSCQAAAGIGRAVAAPDILADAATVLRWLPNSAIMPQVNALCREALAGLPATDTVRTAQAMAQGFLIIGTVLALVLLRQAGGRPRPDTR